ncbi:MAG: hypothetical protein M3O28_12355 [Actinomycetota bacterium]|nr:hypothetical protein [Actinomycetota bacterium]
MTSLDSWTAAGLDAARAQTCRRVCGTEPPAARNVGKRAAALTTSEDMGNG